MYANKVYLVHVHDSGVGKDKSPYFYCLEVTLVMDCLHCRLCCLYTTSQTMPVLKTLKNGWPRWNQFVRKLVLVYHTWLWWQINVSICVLSQRDSVEKGYHRTFTICTCFPPPLSPLLSFYSTYYFCLAVDMQHMQTVKKDRHITFVQDHSFSRY